MKSSEATAPSGNSGEELKDCPHCGSAIPAAASVCAACAVDLTTGQPVVLGSGPDPVASAQTKTPVKLAGPTCPDQAVRPATKPCINCGVPILAQMHICPACSADQHSVASRIGRERAIRRSRRLRSTVGFLLFVLILSGLSAAAYLYRAPLSDRFRRWRAGRAAAARRRKQARPTAAKPPPGKPTSKPSRPVYRKVKAVCPMCSGEGFYMRNPTSRESCPACARRGSRTITVRDGTKLCPDCRGIGKVEDRNPRASPSAVRQGLRRRARKCERCQGRGTVRSG